MTSIPAAFDYKVNDECIEDWYYDTSWNLCISCMNLCYKFDSTFFVDHKCCTVLQTCEGGLPQFASGCAQSLESTSKAYGNLNEGVFLQVTDSTNDLQQKALDSRALIIVAIIIELSLLSLLSLIAIGCIRKFIRYSKDEPHGETEEGQSLFAKSLSTICQLSLTSSEGWASNVRRSESNCNPTASPLRHQISAVKSFESNCHSDASDHAISFESINHATKNPASHRTNHAESLGNTYTLPYVVAQSEHNKSSESNCNTITNHLVAQTNCIDSSESICETAIGQGFPQNKFIDSFQSNRSVNNSYFVTQSDSSKSSKSKREITENHDTTQCNFVQNYESNRDTITSHAATQHNYMRTLENNSDVTTNQTVIQNNPMKSFVFYHNASVENSKNNYSATSNFVSNNNALAKSDSFQCNHDAPISSACNHNDAEKEVDILVSNAATRLPSNQINYENDIKCRAHAFTRNGFKKHLDTSYGTVAGSVGLFTQNSSCRRATVRNASLNFDLQSLSGSYHAFRKPVVTNQHILLKELKTIVLQLKWIKGDIDQVLLTEWATHTSRSVSTSNSGIGNEIESSTCVSEVHSVNASDVYADFYNAASPSSYRQIAVLPGSEENVVSSVVTSCTQSTMDSLQPNCCESIHNPESNFPFQNAAIALQLAQDCTALPALTASSKLLANEQHYANSVESLLNSYELFSKPHNISEKLFIAIGKAVKVPVQATSQAAKYLKTGTVRKAKYVRRLMGGLTKRFSVIATPHRPTHHTHSVDKKELSTVTVVTYTTCKRCTQNYSNLLSTDSSRFWSTEKLKNSLNASLESLPYESAESLEYATSRHSSGYHSGARTPRSHRSNKLAEQLVRPSSSLFSNELPSLQSTESLAVTQSTLQVSSKLKCYVSSEKLTSLIFPSELSDVQSTKSLVRTPSSLQLYRKSQCSSWCQSAQSLENNSIDHATLLNSSGSTKSSKNYVKHSRSLESLNKNALPTGISRTETDTHASCWSFGDDALTDESIIRYSITSGSTMSASSEKILVAEDNNEKRFSKSTDSIPMQLGIDPRRLKEELYRKQLVPCQPSSTSTTPMSTLTTKTVPTLDASAKSKNKINKQNSQARQSNTIPQQKIFRLQVMPRSCKRPSEHTCRKVEAFNEHLRSSRRKRDTTLALLDSELSINNSSTKSVAAELIRGLSQENLPPNLQSALQQLLQHARRKRCVRLLEDFFRQSTLAVDLLTAACVSGWMRTVTRLTADFKIDINEQDLQGWSPLTATCADGSFTMVKWLINETAADTTITNTDLQTPLIVACDKYRPDIIRLLLSDEYAQYLENDVNMPDVTERTALHYVVEHNTNYGRTYLHELCLRSDVIGVRNVVYSMYPREVNAQDNDGWTPLHLACMTGNVDIAKMLLWCGAEVDARDDDWDTPGDLAEAAGNGYMVDMLKLKPEIDWQPSYFPFYQDIIDHVVVYNYYY